MIAVHLRGRVDRHVVELARRRQQPRLLLDGEDLGGLLLGGAMDAHARTLPAPQLSPALGVGEIDEGLAGEERAPHELHLALDPRLVLRRAHSRRVDLEPTGLRVLDEGLVEARLQRIGRVDHRGEVVGDQRAEDTAEEPPCRLTAGDDVRRRLAVREPHEAVPAETRGEDQRVHDPVAARHRIGDEPHATEVHLQLVAGLAVSNRHRRAPAAPAAQDLGDVALHRPGRDLDAAPGQQLGDLHPGDIVVDTPRSRRGGPAAVATPRHDRRGDAVAPPRQPDQ